MTRSGRLAIFRRGDRIPAWRIAAAIAGVVAVGARVHARCATHELLKLTADHPAAQDVFGFAVALDGNVALIGAHQGGLGSTQPGAAFAYRLDGTEWVPEDELTASDGSGNDQFGAAVGLDGDLAVVGAFNDDAGAGSAYVFRYDSAAAGWTQEAKLTADDRAAGDRFGFSVSISGGVVLIGSNLDTHGGIQSGSAYVFRYLPGPQAWVQEAKLVPSDAAPGDSFGFGVALAGDVALVGSEHDDDAGSNSGSAYVFRYDPIAGSWPEEAKLTTADAAADDQVGRSVDTDGHVALLGAWRDDDAGANAGSAYVFRYDAQAGTWQEEDELIAADTAAQDQLGRSVAVDRDTALVGAHFDDDAGSNSGSAYVFRFDGSRWNEVAKYTSSDAGAQDRFGFAMALSGHLALIGAYQDDDGATNAGSAYFFGGNLDCDGNAIVDACDLAAGTTTDCNTNGVPDVCGDAQGDCDCNGRTDLSDLPSFTTCLAGPRADLPAPCTCADLDGDDDSDLADYGGWQRRVGGDGN